MLRFGVLGHFFGGLMFTSHWWKTCDARYLPVASFRFFTARFLSFRFRLKHFVSISLSRFQINRVCLWAVELCAGLWFAIHPAAANKSLHNMNILKNICITNVLIVKQICLKITINDIDFILIGR